MRIGFLVLSLFVTVLAGCSSSRTFPCDAEAARIFAEVPHLAEVRGSRAETEDPRVRCGGMYKPPKAGQGAKQHYKQQLLARGWRIVSETEGVEMNGYDDTLVASRGEYRYKVVFMPGGPDISKSSDIEFISISVTKL